MFTLDCVSIGKNFPPNPGHNHVHDKENPMQTIVQPTTIRKAFEGIKVMPSAFTDKGKEIAGKVHDAIMSKAGLFKVPSSHYGLSFKTHKKLVAEGILPGADGGYVGEPKKQSQFAV